MWVSSNSNDNDAGRFTQNSIMCPHSIVRTSTYKDSSTAESEMNEDENIEADGDSVSFESSSTKVNEDEEQIYVDCGEFELNPVPSTAFGNSAASSPGIIKIDDIDPSLRSILGDIEIPEGVDPSFLAALPNEMREEVIAEHLR